MNISDLINLAKLAMKEFSSYREKKMLEILDNFRASFDKIKKIRNDEKKDDKEIENNFAII